MFLVVQYNVDYQSVDYPNTTLTKADTFESALVWCERQSECCSTQLLLLKRRGDLSATKRETNLTQKQMSDYNTARNVQ